jgi:hypothetical protein
MTDDDKRRQQHMRGISITEQASACARDQFAPFLWTFYKSLVDQGFAQPQALHLTTEYMKSMFVNMQAPKQKDDDEG